MWTSFYRWILTMFSYEIKNTLENKSKLPYVFELMVLGVYTVISLYNALAMLFQIPMLSGNKAGSPSVISVLLNIIVLMKLHISIHIKKTKNIERAMEGMVGEGIVNEIEIKTWQKRSGLVCSGYIIDIVILGFFMVYGQTVSESLAAIGIVAVMETFIDGLLNNLTARYEVDPKVFVRA